MPRRISVLPDALANQIAAGEVVERPASVVKELIENALDAAATRIDVTIRNGGKTEIRVVDDGCGMNRDDALLCLDRHATSKISKPEDLRAVRTFGFRGEALPSIASVSRLLLETAEQGGVGTRVRVTAGRIEGAEDCARQRGTTVVVRSLFLNVPARAKFLRGAAVETRAIVDVTVTLALANLSTAIRLESNGRTLLDLPAARDLVARVAALWGDESAARLIPIADSAGPIGVGGLIERPDAALAGPRRVHLFVDGRPFRDRELVYAAERAYRTTVPYGARPTLLLYLRTAGGDIDVNVHPSKLEVRFRDRAGAEEAIERAIRAALGRLDSAATLDRPALPQQLRPGPPPRTPAGAGTVGQLQFFVPAREPGADATSGGRSPAMLAGLAAPAGAVAGAAGAGAVVGDRFAGAGPGAETMAGTPDTAPQTALWQVHDTYILAETRSGLLIIDQHSAHERVLFQRMMAGFAANGAASQRLLFPLTIRLLPAEYELVTDMLDLFARTGYEVEPFGGRTIIVHAAPNPHPYFDAERCLREMVGELATGSALTRAATNQHERIAMTFACKAAIKAGQKLSDREMSLLFEQLFETDLPYHDVHGRPTVIRISVDELERRFGRRG